MVNKIKLKILLVLLLVFGADSQTILAQEKDPGIIVDTLAASAPPDDATQDNARFEPYKSQKSFVKHVLSTPAYIVHGISRPFGPVIQFAEEVIPKIFPIQIKNFTIFPNVEIGGQNPITFAAQASNNNFGESGNTLEIDFSISSGQTNNLRVAYKLKNVFSEGDQLSFTSLYRRDDSRKYFPGNDFPEELERFYDEEVAEFGVGYKKNITDVISYNMDLSFQSSDIGEGDFKKVDPVPGDFLGRTIDEFRVADGDTLLLFPNELEDVYGLLDFKAGLEFDFTEPVPRQYKESRIMLDGGITRSINSSEYGFVNYRVEYNQFVPIFFKPESRRLAFRAVMEKVEPLENKEIPFFRKPVLGDPDDLRGFENNRFRNDGALYYSVEYRYLVWKMIDGVLFVDQGQVFNDFNDIALNDFHTDYGFGFHILNSKGISVRWEFAFSEDNNRTVLAFGANF